MKKVAKVAKREDCYAGFYFDSSEDKQELVKLANKLTANAGVKYSLSDVIRLALKEFIERNK